MKIMLAMMASTSFLTERAVPDGSLRLPETTFARALIKVAREYPPVSLLYVRANPQNWQYFTSPWLVFAGVLLEDFHSSRLYLREGMRAMEGYDSHLCYPDGGELQRDLHYNDCPPQKSNGWKASRHVEARQARPSQTAERTGLNLKGG